MPLLSSIAPIPGVPRARPVTFFGWPEVEILRPKETELSRGKAEVEALGTVAPLLSDEADASDENLPVTTRWTASPRPIKVPKGANTDPQPEHAPEWKARTAGFP